MDDGVLGVTGGEQDRQVWAQLAHLPGELPGPKLAGHDHVGEHQVDRLARAHERQGALGVGGLHRPIAEVLQHGHGGRTHRLLVLHHQDHPAVAVAGGWLCRGRGGGRLARTGQVDLYRRAVAGLGIDLDVAARLFDEAIDHGEAKPGALAVGLGGEERLEHPRLGLLAHPLAGVGDGQQHILAGRDVSGVACIGLVEHGVGDLHRQPPAAGHGVPGVEGQVQERALHLRRIGDGVPQAAGHHRLHLDRLAQGPAQQVGHVADQPREVDHLRGQGLAPGERQQLAGQLRRPLGAVDGVLQPLAGPLVVGDRALQQVEVAADHLQQVIEVVGDPAGQLAHRLQPLGVAQPLLGPFPVGDVADGADDPLHRSVRPGHRRQDGFPDSRTARKASDLVAGGHRPAARHHPSIVGDQPLADHRQHRSDRAAAHLRRRDAQGFLEGRIDVGQGELVVVANADDDQIVGRIGEDRSRQGVHRLARGVGLFGILHRPGQPAVGPSQQDHPDDQPRQRQQADHHADDQRQPLRRVRLGGTGGQQQLLAAADIPHQAADIVHRRASAAAGDDLARASVVAGALQRHHPVDHGLAAVDQVRQRLHPRHLRRVVGHQLGQRHFVRGDRAARRRIGRQVTVVAGDQITALAAFAVLLGREQVLGGLYHCVGVGDPVTGARQGVEVRIGEEKAESGHQQGQDDGGGDDPLETQHADLFRPANARGRWLGN